METRFLFLSAFRGWGFNLKWSSRDVNNSSPPLTKVEVKQVVWLRGIISSSMAIKSMIEAWLEAMGRSPAIEGMTRFVCMNLLGMKKAVVARASHPEVPLPTAKPATARAPCPETPLPAIEPVAEKPEFVEVGSPLKILKNLGDPSVLAPKSKLKPKLAPGEGSNRKEKGVAHPWSMRDLCWVKA
ncbi:hypothetical protein BHE74_00025619 [Ensete ventricosum]|nr:hypothetical protein BHE74_00025619 [Ensete ventricosum]